MLGTQLLIFLMRKMEHIFVCFLQEDVAQLESIVSITTESLLFKIVKQLIKQKIYLEELDLVHLDKT
jgi:hypothetical protein